MNVNLYTQIDAAVKERIELGIATLPLPELKSVHSQLYPDISSVADIDLPAASVCEWGEAANWEPNSSESSATWVPVLVVVMDKIGDTNTPHSNKSTYLKIHKAIADMFKPPASGTFSLNGVPEVKRCMIVPSVFIDRRLPGFSHVMAAIGLRFWAPEEGV